MIERLAVLLVHVIAHSADHGLEDAETRVAAGKPPAGNISLVARHAGAEVLISVSDNGRGLDAKRIRAKAEENGLIAAGAALSDAELYQLIFQPGFRPRRKCRRCLAAASVWTSSSARSRHARLVRHRHPTWQGHGDSPSACR